MNWTIQITLTYGPPGAPFVPDYPPVRAKGRGRAWYRGDCHLHTVYSDGHRLPSEVAEGARAAGLDFITSTDHNTSSSDAVWGQYAGEDLLIITGEEATTRNGHYVITGLPAGTWIDWRYRARDGELPGFVRQIHRAGAIAVAAHPFATCLACAWKFGYAEMDAVEVWNGPWTPDDEVAVQMFLDQPDGLLEVVRCRHREGDAADLLADVHGDNVRALLCQPHRMATALAAGRASDEGDLAARAGDPARAAGRPAHADDACIAGRRSHLARCRAAAPSSCVSGRLVLRGLR